MKILTLLLLCFSFFSLSADIPMVKEDMPLDISLKNPTYKKGIISTDEGGVVRGENYYLQAQHIAYEKNESKQLLKAHGDLLLDHKGKLYRADSVTINFIDRSIEAENATTRWGDWFIVAERITLSFEGNGFFHNATLTTSNNEKDDWSFSSKEIEIKRGEYIDAHPVIFKFEKIPLLYLPHLSKSLKKDDKDMHLSYRVRYGSQGLIFGVQTLFYESPNWAHTAVVDYSVRYGLGCGVKSEFQTDDRVTRFNCLNYVAQSKQGIQHVESTRYRLLGGFRSYNEPLNIKTKGMYDKLSDKGMQTNFLDHHTRYVKAGLTQLTFSKQEEAYLARLNSVVRVNNFQTIKQELPLFSINQRAFELGNSGMLLDQRFSAGYLRYVYANHTPHATNFGSSRTELDQKISRPIPLSVFQVTPWAGWRGVQYSRSPRDGSVVQAIGEGGVKVNTHLIGQTERTMQLLEPYVDVKLSTNAVKRANKVYIFDIQDSFQRVCFAKPGFQHTTFFLPNRRGYQPSLYSEVYGIFFFNTPHLQSNKPRLRWNEVCNLTERAAVKTGLEYDCRRHSWTFGSVLFRYTFTQTLAAGLEYRAQDKWYLRKLDTMNYDVEAFHSAHRLLRSDMSDPRNSWIFSVYWTPNPRFDMEFKTITGFNRRQSKSYYVRAVDFHLLVRGALRVSFSVARRTGKIYSFTLNANLGQKKGRETLLFDKISRGNYDIW